MKELHQTAHERDPYRVTGIRRCEFCKDIVDVYSPSIWAGWYRGIYPKYEEYSRHGFEHTSRFIHMEWGRMPWRAGMPSSRIPASRISAARRRRMSATATF
ncbi:hypothetical protein [Paenibacillus protaetiae]|uniref:hypothetical protein n=1 Tax=Paenibacillus protaetiae TaxID=2509456 RepID=UPI001FCA22B0|nr:hypothetical protein [Paenibacillus protaetiae]